MSTVLQDRSLPRAGRPGWLPWAAILAGLALLYVPTYAGLAAGAWREDAYAHGPIILAVFLWLAWRGRDVLRAAGGRPAPAAGLACLVAGLALYLLGRTQSLAVFEVASHIPVIAGAVLLLRGWSGLARFAFPILFLLFLVPLPGFVLDAATMPLKETVSIAVAALMQLLGYPVAREGVILAVGGHEMLIADACSGLNSLYSLFALGLLYHHVTKTGDKPGSAATARADGRAEYAQHEVCPRFSALRMGILLACIVPIAIVANVFRVLGLVLVTYHFGAEAAEGWFHAFAGMMVFIVALLLIVALDRLLFPHRGQTPFSTERSALPAGDKRGLSPVLAVVAGVLMAGTAMAAPALKPQPEAGPAIDLERVIPAAFGDWRVDPSVVPVTPAPDVQAKLDRIYDQIVSRTYVNGAGEAMMLTVAYGGDQTDALKAHRQEACYAAQGFEIRGLESGRLAAAGRDIPVTRLLAVRGERSEPVTYWFTMGDRVVLGRFERLRVQLANGLEGRIPDGVLVRVSSLSRDTGAAHAAQQSFIAAIVAAMPDGAATRLVGAARN